MTGAPDPAVHTTTGDRFGDVFRLTRLPLMTLRQGADRDIPGPKGLPVVGVSPQLMRNPSTYLHEASRKYGDVFRIPVPIHDLVIITHPDLIRQVFYDRGVKYGFAKYPKFAKSTVGQSLPFLDGDAYAERRNLITPMFGKRFLAGLSDDFVDEMIKRLGEWEQFADTGTVIDLQHEIGRILLPAFMRNMFSMELTERQIHTYDRDLRELVAFSASLVWCRRPPNILPIPGLPNFAVSMRRMLKAVNQMLDDRANEPAKRNDLLQILVDARLPDGTRVDRKDMAFDAISIMVAGYDTVRAALAWMFSLLPANPEAQQRLFDEVDSLGGATPTATHLAQLGWSKQCFDEAQRLQGHPFNARWSKADNELAGFHIPKGTFIGACMTALHRDPRWWARPDSYDPHHFDQEQVAARANTTFIPFGVGPHQCVGIAMAYQNGLLLTALILQRYRVHLQPGWTPTHKHTTTVTIRGGVPCTISRR
jgi:cytochrome P450